MHWFTFVLLALLGMIAGASAILQQVVVASLRMTVGSVTWAVSHGTLATLLIVFGSRAKLTAPATITGIELLPGW